MAELTVKVNLKIRSVPKVYIVHKLKTLTFCKINFDLRLFINN